MFPFRLLRYSFSFQRIQALFPSPRIHQEMKPPSSPSFPQKPPSKGCFFPVFLRHIICSGGLPTYPLDHPKKFDTETDYLLHEIHQPQQQQQLSCLIPEKKHGCASPAPSLVLKLMGLNSMPAEYNSHDSENRACSVGRGESTSFLGWKSEEKEEEIIEVEYKKSELPSDCSLEIEDDDFLVLKLDNGGELGYRHLKFVDNNEEKKQGKSAERQRVKQSSNVACFDDDGEEGRVRMKISEKIDGNHVDGIQCPCRRMGQKYNLNDSSTMTIMILMPEAVVVGTGEQGCGEVLAKKESRGICVGGRESEPQNSSPVSVLDLQPDYPGDLEVSTPEEDSGSRTYCHWIRNLTSNILNEEFPSEYTNGITKLSDVVEHYNASEGKTLMPQNYSLGMRHYNDSVWMLVKTSMNAKIEVFHLNPKLRESNKTVDCEDVVVKVVSQIFDQLLNELMVEFQGA